MLAKEHDVKYLTLTAALLIGTAAQSATISASSDRPDNAGWASHALDINAFTPGAGRCGYGSSVTGDGCAPVIKSDPTARHAYGRLNPDGGSWVDSQDLEVLTWSVERATPMTSFSFALVDAYDQKSSRDGTLGASYFNIALMDGDNLSASWEIPSREQNSTLHWITVTLDRAVDRFDLVFNTRINDGYGVMAASAVCR